MIPPPFGRAGVGFSISPNPSPREGSVDGWGKYGLRSSLLAFKTKWRKKGQKRVSPRQRLGNCSQPTFAQNGQKNYYSVHSLCHSAVVGCYSFAPFGGVSLLHPIPRALPGAGISMPLRGVTNTHPRPLPKGGGIEAYTSSDRKTKGQDTHIISDRRTKEHNTPSLQEGWGGLHIIPNPSPREGGKAPVRS